ncbi:MAG: hypothetical protein JWN70_2578 [Planctomycetaceae bacterium]|nr:hypothetical protein [Planctomycetaceae bacterium]
MPRRRVAADRVEEGGAPRELRDPDHIVWSTPDRTTRWLEEHRLVRRLRGSENLKGMTALERHNYAAGLWAVAGGNFIRYGTSSVETPDKGFLRASGVPDTIQRRTDEALADVHVKAANE